MFEMYFACCADVSGVWRGQLDVHVLAHVVGGAPVPRLHPLNSSVYVLARDELVELVPVASVLVSPRPAIQNLEKGVGVDEVGGGGEPAEKRSATFGGLLLHCLGTQLHVVADRVAPHVTVPVSANQLGACT